MGQIILKNQTGHKRGNFVHYYYGQDLFGYLYLDVVRRKQHRASVIKQMLFDNPRDFVCTLDLELDRRENHHYQPWEPAFTYDPSSKGRS
ncbi:MAG: hypothetical protein KDK39_07345 [Leptospiraceae bacterium]|nr:hypothetical protein [Leptospiraceae bacterium]